MPYILSLTKPVEVVDPEQGRRAEKRSAFRRMKRRLATMRRLSWQ